MLLAVVYKRGAKEDMRPPCVRFALVPGTLQQAPSTELGRNPGAQGCQTTWGKFHRLFIKLPLFMTLELFSKYDVRVHVRDNPSR